MAVLSVVQTGRTAVENTLVTADVAGDSFPNTGIERFRVRNADASPKTVTILAQSAAGCPAGTPHNEVISVPAGEERVIRNLDPTRFNDSNERVNVTYSAVTSVTVGVET